MRRDRTQRGSTGGLRRVLDPLQRGTRPLEWSGVLVPVARCHWRVVRAAACGSACDVRGAVCVAFMAGGEGQLGIWCGAEAALSMSCCKRREVGAIGDARRGGGGGDGDGG
eukprot:5436407-Pleurochrysis_carterae.AAC.2